MNACAGAEPTFSDPSESRHQLHTHARCVPAVSLVTNAFCWSLYEDIKRVTQIDVKHKGEYWKRNRGNHMKKQKEPQTIFMTSNAALIRCPPDMFGKCNSEDKQLQATGKSCQKICFQRLGWSTMACNEASKTWNCIAEAQKSRICIQLDLQNTSWAHGQAARH